MKKVIVSLFAVFALLIASDSYASRAKLLVMGSHDGSVFLDGSGSGGSFVYDSPYDMFWNPALVNNYNNWAIIEKSNYVLTDTTRDVNKDDTGTASRIGTTAQGGFIMSLMNFRLGLFLNRVSGVDRFYNNRNNMRPVDLVLGSEMRDLKWGLGLTYANFRGSKENSASGISSDHDLNARLGVVYNDFEPFVGYKAIGNENTTETQRKYRDIRAGFRYNYGEWRPMLAFKRVRSANVQFTTYGASLGRAMRVAEGVKLFYSAGYWKENIDNHQMVPLSVSVEGWAAKWLALRAGLQYFFLNRRQDVTVADNTTGRFGASISSGGVSFDFAIGKTSAASTATENGSSAAQAETSDVDSQNFDFSNGLFTAASLSYKW